MRDDDPVLAIEVAGSVYVLPWWVMKNHHVANLTIEARSFLITLCEVCASSCCFEPEVDGRELHFEWTGHHNGAILITDKETGSLWSPFDGECFQGTYTGVRLKPFPLYQSYWQEWKDLHPLSFVAGGEGEPRDGHGAKYRPTTETSGFLKELPRLDGRLPPHTLVLAVHVAGETRAYPLFVLHGRGGLLVDTLGGEEIVVLSRPGSLMTLAFSRVVQVRRRNFAAGTTGAVRDPETGEEWGWFGEVLQGSEDTPRLTFVKSALEKWYVWSAYHPDTSIFEPESAAPEDIR
jgi:hypothetical protein